MTVSPAVSTILTEVCLMIERTAPASFDEDSDLARDLKNMYPDALRRTLARADWPFASKLAYLPEMVAPEGTAVDPDLPYLYAMPGDCVTLREVGASDTKWRRDAEGIRSDDSLSLRIRYTQDKPDEANFPAEFRAAVAAVLAATVAPTYAQSQAKIDRLDSLAEQRIKHAARSLARDASGARYDGLPDQPDWVSERTA